MAAIPVAMRALPDVPVMVLAEGELLYLGPLSRGAAAQAFGRAAATAS